MTHRIATLGLHHDHVWGVLEELSALSTPDRVEWLGAADGDAELRNRYQARFPGEVVESYEALLEREELTAVYVFASNRLSEELVVKACERGLHCLVEKPMAASLAGAERMLAAARANEVRLMVNWPFAWWPQLRHGIVMAQAGELGRVWQVRYRAAHQGPVELGCSRQFCEWLYDADLNGAGALMDYCCYGAVLAEVILGLPESVTGLRLRTGLKPDLKAEDNAVLLLKYPGALATTEASWTQVGHLTSYSATIYGSEGTFHIEPGGEGRILHATAAHPDGIALEVPPQPDHLRNASAHFLAAIEDPGLEIHPLCDPQHGRNAQWILEEGMRGAAL